MASASLPEFYEYEKIDGREFWDGGIISGINSNTQRILGIPYRLNRVEGFHFRGSKSCSSRFTISRYAKEKPNKYLDILKAQFEITKLETIDRRDDIHTIAGKIGDFTSEIINTLLKEGYESNWKEYPQFVLQRATIMYG